MFMHHLGEGKRVIPSVLLQKTLRHHLQTVQATAMLPTSKLRACYEIYADMKYVGRVQTVCKMKRIPTLMFSYDFSIPRNETSQE